jgi:hypothetical protein
MKGYLNEKLDEIDTEWNRPLSVRLGKVLTVAFVTMIASWATEKAYERVLANAEKKQEVDMLEQLLDQ